MGNINGGNNPYENLTKSSFVNAKVIWESQEASSIDLSQPIYRVITGNYIDDYGEQQRFQRVLDTRYLFKPSEFWNINMQLNIDENIFIDDVMYWNKVDQKEFLLDQSLEYKNKITTILYQSKIVH